MPKPTPIKSGRYAKQRPAVPIPMVTIATLRKAKGLTLQAICDHINEELGLKVDRGTISAIELGHRRASTQMLAAIAEALGIHPTDVDTAYEPRERRSGVVA
ncbi:helix-turn-helix domain-containing protein [Mycolicibacterium fluoranthenivorans]|uniref:Transcriptional regulator with XRE-family HTH domain n=1 Tax=Mycolicibacterium fluoranthenivorans TaxID=258505 RepID=A0A7X5ZG66_9MYCO|nr:helix-turn-helix transcriptional regulator [Mycolicibacterium fluoranthenivorans]MCV7359160.1 helix-turn-helix transcriptional regulator [Mycolicibacterium fluoranthenivorans]NIH98954.1 transcriptional regulator with XRE-family HTH domain [Mycolicibacterium fluoranthenivorans]